MTIFTYLKVMLMAFYWHLPGPKDIQFQTPVEISREFKRRERRRKRLTRKEFPIPRPPRKLKGHLAYRSTKSKDPRFSNQRKLRRMYRGV